MQARVCRYCTRCSQELSEGHCAGLGCRCSTGAYHTWGRRSVPSASNCCGLPLAVWCSLVTEWSVHCMEQHHQCRYGEEPGGRHTAHFADLKPLVNSYIQQEVQIKWDVSIHGRDLCLLKPTLGPPKRFRHLTRAEEVVITRLRIGHTKATKSHILSEDHQLLASIVARLTIPTFGIRARAALPCVGGRNAGGYGCNSPVLCRPLCIV